MIRLIEIYSQLEAVDGFLALMLKQSDNYSERIIKDRIAGLVEYIDHLYHLMWELQGQGKLCDFDTRYILPAISEIWLRVKREPRWNDWSHYELARSITKLISLLSFYLSRIEGNNDKNRVLH
ncbi:hypothetical protein DPU24_24645 [Salmonella enterica subsp. enterica serovar Oranienburg]|nr:hypothetical protein [Salmonella enterica subsp. enterica serovar Newport]EBW6363935.1 hypothetical protein [Salmonella enterica subsp. enterica serovar Oranienburg]EDU7786921.1 hypothetical protein [Salmonella enterica subsp. enterica serovar Oranienburg]HAK8204891.1 hypothetical protein [Salmonella enterica]